MKVKKIEYTCWYCGSVRELELLEECEVERRVIPGFRKGEYFEDIISTPLEQYLNRLNGRIACAGCMERAGNLLADFFRKVRGMSDPFYENLKPPVPRNR